MSGAEIEDYARIVLINAMSPNGWPEGFHRRSDLFDHLKSTTLPAIEEYDPRLSDLTYSSLFDQILIDLENSDAVSKTTDKYAGEYYSAVPINIKQFKNSVLQSSSIYGMANSIGFNRFFSDVFAGFRQDPDADRTDGIPLVAPPSDNRLIVVPKKALEKIETPLVEIIESVRSDNVLGEHPQLRDRLMGQLKAGREMLLSGVVKAQLLYWVLLRALGELVERYGKKAIGVAAAKLIELIIEELMKK